MSAYRLVQRAVDTDTTGPVAVRLARTGTTVTLTVDGGAQPEPAELDRWVRRVAALGGRLETSPGRLRLVLPLPPLADPRAAAQGFPPPPEPS